MPQPLEHSARELKGAETVEIYSRNEEQKKKREKTFQSCFQILLVGGLLPAISFLLHSLFYLCILFFMSHGRLSVLLIPF